jgi:hypothetical protein
LVGLLSKTSATLKTSHDLTEAELKSFKDKAALLAVLVPTLSYSPDSVAREMPMGEQAPVDAERLHWGPKTTDPGPDQTYPSKKLRELIDMDPSLEPEQ